MKLTLKERMVQALHGGRYNLWFRLCIAVCTPCETNSQRENGSRLCMMGDIHPGQVCGNTMLKSNFSKL